MNTDLNALCQPKRAHYPLSRSLLRRAGSLREPLAPCPDPPVVFAQADRTNLVERNLALHGQIHHDGVITLRTLRAEELGQALTFSIYAAS